MKKFLFTRYSFIGFLFTIFGIVIFLWMARIQIGVHKVQAAAPEEEGSLYTTEILDVERGNIYDRWGKLLAGNKVVYELSVNLDMVQNQDTLDKELERILDIDYYGVINNVDIIKHRYVTLTDFVTPAQIAEIEEAIRKYKNYVPAKKSKEPIPSMSGLEWTPHLVRTYPENALASNVLGFYAYKDRSSGGPHFGIEEKYDDILKGTPIKLTYSSSTVPGQSYSAAGASLVLTIDREIQAMTEDILDGAIEKTQSVGGTIIVMDPKNGEILSMAINPRMNPNEYWKPIETSNSASYNRAIDYTYETGSVFKVFTMAAAIDTGMVQPTTTFVDTGSFEIGGIVIKNWDSNAWGQQDMIGCMRNSLNVCLANLANELGPTTFYEYIKRFGLNQPTNIDLSGELTWPVHFPESPFWGLANLGTNSFGQAIATTPIQMITGLSAMANDGKIMAPHVVKTMIKNGEKFDIPVQLVATPISAETARTMTEMLTISVQDEAFFSDLPGYLYAGKTGTGEIATEFGYTTSETNASFVGWGPVDDPRYIIYVWLERPKTAIWGSVVAAPVFRDVMKELVVYLNIPPDQTRQMLLTQ